MRAAFLAIVLATLAAGAARAGDLTDPVWAKAPDRGDWARAYPAGAARAGISGAVKMRCAADAAGTLQNCAVIQEAPIGQGFGAAALSLAPGMELKPDAQDGRPVAGRSLIVPIRFEPALLHPGAVVGNPDWLKLPKLEDLQNYFPAEAAPSGGKVMLDCIVTNRGLMDSCKVQSENPPGHGYGSSALAMTPLFLMRPMTVDGLPVGGAAVRIPIVFGKSSPSAISPGTTIHVLSGAPWLAAPTPGDMAAAYPKAALGKVRSAHVVLRCGVGASGRLENCDKVSEDPPEAGFERAARSLVKDFRVITNPKVDRYENLRIDVPFDFRDPSQTAVPVEAHNPMWLRRISSPAALALYPQAAIKAGYKTGGATVECSVVHDGSLTGCEVVTEAPANVGFGDAALKIASVMVMNLWTSQGTPVDGMKIDLPIRMVLPDEPPAPPAAASPPAK